MLSQFLSRALPALLTIALFTPSTAHALFDSGKVVSQTSDRTNCIPAQVQEAAKAIAEKFGKLTVKSAYRSPKDNRRRGGAKASQHMKCKAIDFLVPNGSTRANQQKLNTYLRSIKSQYRIRYNVYCSGRAHIDNNNQGLPDNYSSCVGRPTYANGKVKTYKRRKR